MNEKKFQTQISNSSTDVITFFDMYAPTWDERFGNRTSTTEFHKIRLEIFLKVANLKKNDCIAELGVGTGPYLDTLSPLVKEIICIDGSKQMLDVLQVKHRHLPNLKIIQMDLAHPIKDASFQVDLVYAFGLWEHIINADTLIMNCKKLLNPQGRAVFVSSNAKSPWYGMMRTLWRAGNHCSSDRYYTKEQMDELMQSQGFIPEAFIYWGYFPAGIGDPLYRFLSLIGKLIDKTWLRQYAGGMAMSYLLTE
ncbi:class I SAM-dependent methyltransferase [Chloroflexota bacterium]